jgi:hypothetical protein
MRLLQAETRSFFHDPVHMSAKYVTIHAVKSGKTNQHKLHDLPILHYTLESSHTVTCIQSCFAALKIDTCLAEWIENEKNECKGSRKHTNTHCCNLHVLHDVSWVRGSLCRGRGIFCPRIRGSSVGILVMIVFKKRKKRDRFQCNTHTLMCSAWGPGIWLM